MKDRRQARREQDRTGPSFETPAGLRLDRHRPRLVGATWRRRAWRCRGPHQNPARCGAREAPRTGDVVKATPIPRARIQVIRRIVAVVNPVEAAA